MERARQMSRATCRRGILECSYALLANHCYQLILILLMLIVQLFPYTHTHKYTHSLYIHTNTHMHMHMHTRVVDLGSTQLVKAVAIWPRTDCCPGG